MDVPPTYDEAVAGKTHGAQGTKLSQAPVYSQYNPPMGSSQVTHNFGPPPPPIGGYQASMPYQDGPQVKPFNNF